MQQQAHSQDGGQQKQRQPQAHQQADQVASPDIRPGWQRGRHEQFVGAPGEIPRHAISRDKGQEENQQHQREWKGVKKSPGAGSGNEGVQRHRAVHGTEVLWCLLGPCQEEQEAEEAEGLQPKEAAGAKATQFPGHNASQRKWALDSLGRLPGTGQRSDIHETLLLCVFEFAGAVSAARPLLRASPQKGSRTGAIVREP